MCTIFISSRRATKSDGEVLVALMLTVTAVNPT